MEPFGPGISEARRFINTVLVNQDAIDPESVVIDANVCYSSRHCPRIIKVFGEEHDSISSLENAPLALMVFKMLNTNASIKAYDGKKVRDYEQLIDENGYIWSTSDSWRVAEYKKCEICAACKHKGRYFEVGDETEPYIYTLTRALDEIRETVPCVLEKDGYTVRLLKHYKDLLDKAFVVVGFGAMGATNCEVKLPLGFLTLQQGTLSCSSVVEGAEFVQRFCQAVTAMLKEEESIPAGSSDLHDTMFAEMYAATTELGGTEEAYSLMIARHVGCSWWSTEKVPDENMYNVWKIRQSEDVKALSIDWECVNTATLRRSHGPEPFHFAGRLDGTVVTGVFDTRFGRVCVPRQPEYLRLNGENEVEVFGPNGKKTLLMVNENGALVATTRKKLFLKRFKDVVRGIGISPVSLHFDFSSLGPLDYGGTEVATNILMGHYGDRALRYLLEMVHKARLLVSKNSPCKCYVPTGCLSDHGVYLAKAMPARAFENLVFCCKEVHGEVDENNIFWKPTEDGELFKLDKTAMNLTHMIETKDTVEILKLCQMMIHRDVGYDVVQNNHTAV
ncbi:hypothetical protein BWQ96_05588 [Gracilariopsis chorda]|uniref:Uncharacterized protein n=1 Tax=Gracilariopsis chorda TaxID=448386 RepID=A0A2V3IRA3_9FLOR|nr:hypothetical protein BWQ96_05588 [Gracilariopsis chorda]|eukprot:PXF44646.1 hypothetical protein BWQ96_05588 [Gracilariopsis chorda]